MRVWWLLGLMACGDKVVEGEVAEEADADTDLDDDGYDASVDCDDDDALVNPGASETCDNGVDDDCNGLSDCEDGVCTTSSACMESDCGNGLDDDGDGLQDCRDDDCWGTWACEAEVGGRTIRDFGGGTITRRRWERFREDRTSFGDSTFIVWRRSFSFTDVAGSVGYQTTMGSTGACSFEVGRVSAFQQAQVRITSSQNSFTWVSPVSRSSVQLSSACPIPSSVLFPDYLLVKAGPLRLDGGNHVYRSGWGLYTGSTVFRSWYVPLSYTTASTSTYQVGTTATHGGGVGATMRSSQRTTWTIGALAP